MDLWNSAHDRLYAVLDEARAELTFDQALKAAEIEALLAIGQELSRIQDQGINPNWTQRSD